MKMKAAKKTEKKHFGGRNGDERKKENTGSSIRVKEINFDDKVTREREKYYTGEKRDTDRENVNGISIRNKSFSRQAEKSPSPAQLPVESQSSYRDSDTSGGARKKSYPITPSGPVLGIDSDKKPESRNKRRPRTTDQNEDLKSTRSNPSRKQSKPHTSNTAGTRTHLSEVTLTDTKLSLKPTSTTQISILIMNVSGPDDSRGGVPERRRHIIRSVITKYTPALVLFQEFKWKDIKGKIWKSNPLPEHYSYLGHEDASLMYDTDLLVAQTPSTDIHSILERLQRNPSNQLRTSFPTDFDPMPRMCLRLVTSQFERSLHFVCISWHGVYRRKTIPQRVEYFKYLMEFMRNIHIKFRIPLLIAGDFNVKMDDIEDLVCLPFVLCKYKASKRREKLGVIDYFIITRELNLTNLVPVDMQVDDPDSHPNGILDHDPVNAYLSL